MSNSASTNSGRIGFCGALALLFIGLKLGGVISWSWLWVLSPIWAPFAVVIGIVVFVIGFAGVVELFKYLLSYYNNM